MPGVGQINATQINTVQTKQSNEPEASFFANLLAVPSLLNRFFPEKP
jgi:hypothetical protein